MRSSSSYRGARKNAAKGVGISLTKYNQAFDVAARAAEAAPVGEGAEAARKKLALWAASGGRETAIGPVVPDQELRRMNEVDPTNFPDENGNRFIPVTPDQMDDLRNTAERITTADIDRAMEKALTNWQADGHLHPIVLSKLFAARARQLGWVEDVEFVEER